MTELAKLYAAASFGRGNLNPAMKNSAMNYSEQAERQTSVCTRKEIARAEEYWLARFSGQIPSLDLPVDFPRPANKGCDCNCISSKIADSLYKNLNALSANCGVTLFSTLLAAFEVFLHRLSSQEEFVIGMPVSVKGLEDTTSPIDQCVNLLPLCSKFDPEVAFTEFLSFTRQEVANSLEHQNYFFNVLAHKLDFPHDFSRSPLITVVFNADQTVAGSDLERPDCKPPADRKCFRNCELKLNLRNSGSELQVDCDFDTDLFRCETIRRWLGHYNTILAAITENPGRKLGELPLLNATEKLNILESWNGSRIEIPQTAAIHDYFEARVAELPHAVAVVDKERRVSYSELNNQANQLAHHLRSRGVGPEKLVGVCIERSVEMIIALLAILKSGGTYVALDPNYPKDRLAFMLKDASVSVLVTSFALKSKLPEHEAQVVCLDEDSERIGRNSVENPGKVTDRNSLAYVIYTSGSTGWPKGVALEHRGVVSLLLWARDVYSAEDISGVLASSSICFDISVFEIFAPLSWGGKVVLAQNFLQLPALETAGEVTLINTVPSAMAELLRTGKIPKSVRVINLAGEPLPTTLVDQIYESTEVDYIYDLYGPTEDTVYSTFTQRRFHERANIGHPLPNTQTYILDEKMQLVPPGVRGELHLSGMKLARGYLNQPELTATRFVPNPFGEPGSKLYKTGDIARYLEDGRIEYLGRIDHQIKMRGFRIELGEIESVLRQHPGVDQAVVMPQDGPLESKQLVAYVTARSGTIPEKESMRRHLRSKLPNFMVPGHFVVLSSLPLTVNGKIDRKFLPPIPSSSFAISEYYAGPRNEREALLVEIWEAILKQKPIGVHDNIFEIGGDSLLIFRISNRALQAGLDLEPERFFQCQTIAELAAAAGEFKQKKGDVAAELRRKVSHMSPEEVKRLLRAKKEVMSAR